MKSNTCWRNRALALFPVLVLALPGLQAQSNVLTVAPPQKVTAKRNSTVIAKLSVQLRNGYHVNSNTPSDDYLIPLRMTWTAAPLESPQVIYPAAKMEKYEFSEKPLSVYTGDFELKTAFQVPATAPSGLQVLTGKLRYQACSHKECLPPRTLEVKLPVEISN